MSGWRTTDFRLAAFVRLANVSLTSTEQNARGDTVFVFADGGAAAAAAVRFPGSAEERYDSMCRAMMNLIRQG